jgi:hypothetical protein
VERERRRVVARDDRDVAVEATPPTAGSDLGAVPEKSCHSGDSEGDDYARADQGDLELEIVPACRDLERLGCTVGRRAIIALLEWATFDDVGDVGGLSVQPGLCEKNVKLLAGGPEEWHPFGVLFRARSFADDHQIGRNTAVSIHAPEDDLVAGACERAKLTVFRAHAYGCESPEHYASTSDTARQTPLPSCHPRGRCDSRKLAVQCATDDAAIVFQKARQQGFGTYGLGSLVIESLDAGDSSGDPSLMNYGAIVDPDGPAIEVRAWNPLRGRRRLVALFAVALAADFGMRFSFDRMIGSIPWTFWLLTATEWIGGLCALLIPVAVVVRTPDAWISRRALVLGVVLGAAAELLAAAGEGVIAVNWWLLPSGIGPELRFPLMQGIYWSERLVGISGAVLIGFALTQVRTRPVPRRVWPWIGGCLVAALAVPLLAPGGAGVAGPAMLTAALLGVGTLAGTYRLWAVLAGWFASESPRRPWALAGAGAVVSIAASIMWLAIIDWNVSGEPAVIVVAVTATAGTLLTLLAFADGLGAQT